MIGYWKMLIWAVLLELGVSASVDHYRYIGGMLLGAFVGLLWLEFRKEPL